MNLRFPSDQSLAAVWPIVEADLARRMRPAIPGKKRAVQPLAAHMTTELAALQVGGATILRCEFPANIIANAAILSGGQYRAEPKGDAWIVERVS